MKIGLISRGRTQSSAILWTLFKKHNLTKNLGEIYFEASNNIVKYQSIKTLSDKNYSVNDDFQQQLKDITNAIFLRERFVCKLWPSMLIMPKHKFKNNQTFDDIKSKIIFNITEYFRILDYDQLYYIDRDLHKSSISWVYAKKTKLFHNYKNMKYSPLPITIDENDLDIIRFYVLESCLQEKIKDFLDREKILYTDITEKYTDYIDDSATPATLTNNDYTKLITNYDILPNFIDNWYKVCCENTIDWKYY
jgi:hypothetical protein